MPASLRHGLVSFPRQLRRSRPVDASAVIAMDEACSDDRSPVMDPLAAPAAASLVDAEFALARQHVEALLRALSPNDAGDTAWPATPDRLRSAVEAALGSDRGEGSVLVTRLPRALHSSESWRVRLSAVTPVARDRVAEAVSAARLVPSAVAGGRPDVR